MPCAPKSPGAPGEKGDTGNPGKHISKPLCANLSEMLNCCIISSSLQVTLGSLEAQVSEASLDRMDLKETKDSQDFLVYLDDKVPYL